MRQSRFRIGVWITAILCLAIPSGIALARIVSSWSIERIAREADAIAVGEVLQVSTVGTVSESHTQWPQPLLQKKARIRVLRSLSQPGKPLLSEGEFLSLAYLALDVERGGGITDGPEFPKLSVGDVYAFPLRKVAPPSQNWELVAEEDFSLLIPCVRGPLPDAPRETVPEFLQSELAGTFAEGSYPEICKAAEYLSHYSFADREGKALDGVYSLLVKHVGNDQNRWLEIAVGTYCSMGIPRPTIAALPSSPVGFRQETAFAAKALGHVAGPDVEPRFIEVALRHASLHTWGTAVTFSLNQSPTSLRLLQEALQGDTPEALYIADYLIKDAKDPLIPLALKSATRLLLRQGKVDDHYLRLAGGLITRYGDEHAFSLLLGEIRRCQKQDLNRYTVLWRASFDDSNARDDRSIRLCAIMIGDRRIATDDPSAVSRGIRFCDKAAYHLQKISGVDFGFRSGNTLANRDRAIERAEAWLAKNAPE